MHILDFSGQCNINKVVCALCGSGTYDFLQNGTYNDVTLTWWNVFIIYIQALLHDHLQSYKHEKNDVSSRTWMIKYMFVFKFVVVSSKSRLTHYSSHIQNFSYVWHKTCSLTHNQLKVDIFISRNVTLLCVTTLNSLSAHNVN